MIYRKLSDSELELSVITFGAWAAGGWMWGGTERKDAVDAIRASYDVGVHSIDTAPIYGQGLSEEIVGEAIKGLPRDKVQILTKFGMRWDLAKGDPAGASKNNAGEDIQIYKYAGRESIVEECENSLRRLGTDYIDLYQIHWPDRSTPIAETMEAVAQLIQQGKVRYAGVCNYDETQLAEALRYVPLVSNQVPYSMVKRQIESAVVPYCQQHHLSILAYSPLERGLLTGKMLPGHQFAEGDHRAGLYYFRNDNLQRVQEFMDHLRPMATEKRCSLSQLVLAWTVRRPGITVALVGARNRDQALQNAAAMNVNLTEAEMQSINEAVDQLKLPRD